MIRRRENIASEPLLHHLAEIHHDHAIGEIAHERKIVADKQQSRVVPRLNIEQQIDHRRLHRDIERGDRLVRYHQLGLAGESARDADALLLPARQLRGLVAFERPRQFDEIEQHIDFARHILAARGAEFFDRARDLRADGVGRIERVVGVLKNHLHRAHEIFAAFFDRQRGEILVAHDDTAAAAAFEPHQNLGESRFAAARFADDGDNLALFGFERKILHGLDAARRGKHAERRIGRQFVVLFHARHAQQRRAERGFGARFDVGGICIPVDLLPFDAAHAVVGGLRIGQGGDWRFAAALLLEKIAARPEITAARAGGGERQLAANVGERVFVFVRRHVGDAAEKPARVGVARAAEYLGGAPFFDRLPRIHHAHALAGLENQPHIVRDINHRGAGFAPQFAHDFDDGGLDRHIERGRRLVQQQQIGLGQKRHRDDRPLLLPARQLVRIRGHNPLRIGQAHIR